MFKDLDKKRKENGEYQTATKIFRGIDDLSKTVTKNHSRPIWELIQNAVDSINDNHKVKIELVITDKEFIFSHNGGFFSEEDLLSLIDQVSRKSNKKEKIGRFGTGFITTHLLSKKIQIKGVIKEDSEYSDFDALLDRRGDSPEKVLENLSKTWKNLKKGTKKRKSKPRGFPKAVFKYYLDQEVNWEYIIDELYYLAPYVLINKEEIESIKVTSSIKNILFTRKKQGSLSFLVLNEIRTVTDDKTYDETFISYDNEDIKLTLPVSKNVKKIESFNHIPKLFCDYPLFNTEKFSFPAVINCKKFNPKTERDGIPLSKKQHHEIKENKAIIEKACTNYRVLVSELSERNVRQLYNCVDFRIPQLPEDCFDRDWYKNKIISPMRAVLEKPIVPSISDKMYPILAEDRRKSICFTTAETKEKRDQLWKVQGFFFPGNRVSKKEKEEWLPKISGEDYFKGDLDNFLYNLVDNYTNLDDIEEKHNIDEEKATLLIQEVVSFCKKNDAKLLNEYPVIPDSYGIFRLHKELYLNKIEDTELIDVADLLDLDYSSKLLLEGFEIDVGKSKTIEDISRDINRAIKNAESEDHDEDYKKAMASLCQWFDHNPEAARLHFESLYLKKEKLLIDAVDDKESMYELMKLNMPMKTILDLVKKAQKRSSVAAGSEEEWKASTPIEFGKQGETIFYNMFSKGFKIQKDHQGRDFIIQGKDKQEHSVELKTISPKTSAVLSYHQFKKAVQFKDSYALCVVVNNGSGLDEEYATKNSYFLTDIGDELEHFFDLLTTSFEKIEKKLKNKKGIEVKINLFKAVEIHISEDLWRTGINIEEYKETLSLGDGESTE